MLQTFDTYYQWAFYVTFGLLIAFERIGLFQRHSIQLSQRWLCNFGLLFISSLVVALAIPTSVIALAQSEPAGPLTLLGFPLSLQFILVFMVLDCWRYWEHRLFHQLSLLWRLHLVHHSDTHLDVTTTERHHPIEVAVGTTTLLTLVWLLRLPAAPIAFYLITATVVTLISHTSLNIPASIDRWLRWIIVTPRVHAVHHSSQQTETDSNYGTVLTIWDRIFGSYTDPEQAGIPHFGLSYFHLPHDTRLARVLLQPILYCQNMSSYPKQSDSVAYYHPLEAQPKVVLRQDWKNALIGGAIGLLLVLFVLWPTLVNMISIWNIQEAYQYAWLVIPMFVYLVGWYYREQILALYPHPNYKGLFVVAGASLLWAFAELININVGRHLALILILQGIAITTIGWRCYWRLLPILALLFLMVPSSDVLQPVLRELTVKAIALFAFMANLEHNIDGYVVFIENQRYIVVDQCSGITYVTLAIFLSYSFGLLLYRSMVKIIALTIAGALIGFFSNVVRVNAIVWIDKLQGSQMSLTDHSDIQWLTLSLTLALLFFLLSRLNIEEFDLKVKAIEALPTKFNPAKSVGQKLNLPFSVRSRMGSRLAPILAGTIVFFLVGSIRWLPSDELRAPHAQHASVTPIEMQHWKLTSNMPMWETDLSSNSESLTLTYEKNNQDMRVLIVDTLSPTAKLPLSQLTPGDHQVWREGNVQQYSSCVASTCIDLKHATWRKNQSTKVRHIFYAYSVAGFNTVSKLSLRTAHGWQRITGGTSPKRMIGFMIDDKAPAIEDLAELYLTLQSSIQ